MIQSMENREELPQSLILSHKRTFKMSSLLGLLILLIPQLVFAQEEPCGYIVNDFWGEEERVPIENCADPFDLGSAAKLQDFAYAINGEALTAGEERVVTEFPVAITLETPVSSSYNMNLFSLYRHEGDDFRYVEYAITDRPSTPVTLHALATGTYSIVTSLDFMSAQVQHTDDGWLQLIKWLIPIAYAETSPAPVRGIITFTLVEPTIIEPAGLSSVLFLPGIQASRLYKKSVLGTEDRLWEPNINNDVAQLVMTDSGLSVEDIYTKDVIDEVFGISNIYESFLETLNDLVDSGEIKEFLPFAYDWRYSVHDVVVSGTMYEEGLRGLVDEVERLSDSSYSGQVTVIGHSNGGLLAKDLALELERLEKTDLIDKIIFIGTPHLGTPKALATILHGYDQQKMGGLLIDDATAREAMNNMPGAYGLLPSARYLAESDIPVVNFGAGEIIDPLRLLFGNSVNTEAEYKDFLMGTDGRTNGLDDISSPYTANPALFTEAMDLHRNQLDQWEVPLGIEAFNLVGVGLPSIAALEYREVVENGQCSGTLLGEIVCDKVERFIRPYAQLTVYGDETVTALSAASVSGQDFYFDLGKYNREFINPVTSFQHADFLEIDDVQSFILGLIYSTSSHSQYISSALPDLATEYEVISIDSPVRIMAEDSEGRRTGVRGEGLSTEVVEEIPGSLYFEVAGTKYLITPRTDDVVIHLRGEAYGGYTLRVATLNEEGQFLKSELVNATTTPEMVGSFTRTNGNYSTIHTDLNGDGQFEYEMTLDGVVVEDKEVSFSSLRSDIKSLGLAKGREKPLLVFVDIGEGFMEKAQKRPLFKRVAIEALEGLRKTLSLYKKKKWLTTEQVDHLVVSIDKLRASIK